jgi:hypothetical protein
MPALYPDLGLLSILTDYLSGPIFTVRLFINDYNPSLSSKFTDFVEATYEGYPVGGRPVPAWGDFRVSSPHVGAKTPLLDFRHTFGPTVQNVFGYFVTKLGDNVVLFAERFGAAPILMKDPGDPLAFSVEITARSEFNQ